MRILAATDGSKPALRAVKYAVELLRSLSSMSNSNALISVHDDVGLRHAKAFVGKEADSDCLRELSEKELRPAMSCSIRLGSSTTFRTGHVAQEIVRCARAGKFDLIALGAKGRGAMADLPPGSLAQRVLATADVPVVLAK